MFRTGRFAVMGLSVFLLVLAQAFAASLGAASLGIVRTGNGDRLAFPDSTDAEWEALFSAPHPGGYSYELPDAVHALFQSPYPLSPIPDAEEFAAIQRAAEGGDPGAQLRMGHFLVNGDAVERNLGVGADWYRKAAEQGNARAQYYLGFLYECGAGVERDYAEAFRWYLKAVEQDDPAAHLAVAGFHFAFRKQYMPMYFGRYANWRMKAAYLIGDPGPERPSLEECIWSKYHLADRFYQNDIVLAEILRERSVAGDFEATLELAKMVFHAQGVSRDQALGSRLVFAAAGQGSDAAAYILGSVPGTGRSNGLVLLPHGKTTEERDAFFAVAARRNWNPFFVFSLHNLALLKDWDVHQVTTPEEMRPHWYGLRKLADRGYAPAQFEVAERIFEYNGDPEVASTLLEAASAAGYIPAKNRLGVRRMLGIGLWQNIDKGKELLDELLFSPDTNGVYLLEKYAVEQARFGRIRLAESVLEEYREAGDTTSAVYLGNLHAVTSRGEKPLGLYMEAFGKGVAPAAMVINDYAKKQSKSPGFRTLVESGDETERKIELLADPRYFVKHIALPAAETGYGPAILIVLETLAKDEQFLSQNTHLAEHWLEKYFTHKDWYASRASWFRPYKAPGVVFKALRGDHFPYSLEDGGGHYSRCVGFD